MKALLDTHFLIWILTKSARLDAFPWLSDYQPWGVSPVALLELQYLSEVGRLTMDRASFLAVLDSDNRFMVDEPPLFNLIRHAFDLSWTRDPFDRLLAAHSKARQVPLCTVDTNIRQHHRLLPAQLGRLPT